jgi:hypothetical protein
MGAVGLEPTETEVEGFTVAFQSTHRRKLEYIGATKSVGYMTLDYAGIT